MDTSLAPIDVAAHWPFIRRNLDLTGQRSMQRALGLLAVLQLEARGEPTQVGLARARSAGLTAGEAGRLRVVLRELERRGVAMRFPGPDRRGHAWSFRPEIGRWAAMPWIGSREGVARAVLACSCRAASADGARIPGQRITLPRGGIEFRLSEADHLWRPGLLPVETRGNCEEPGPLVLSVEEDSRLLHSEEEEGRFALLREAVLAVTGRDVWGRPAAQLRELARDAGESCSDVARTIRAMTGVASAPKVVELATERWASGMVLRPAEAEPARVRVMRDELRNLEDRERQSAHVGEGPHEGERARANELRELLGLDTAKR